MDFDVDSKDEAWLSTAKRPMIVQF